MFFLPQMKLLVLLAVLGVGLASEYDQHKKEWNVKCSVDFRYRLYLCNKVTIFITRHNYMCCSSKQN